MMRTELIRRKDGQWNFNIYKQAPYKYNCDENAMLIKAGSQFLPLPGTLQYGHLVKVINKLDFKD